jgi:hypothetical protein
MSSGQYNPLNYRVRDDSLFSSENVISYEIEAQNQLQIHGNYEGFDVKISNSKSRKKLLTVRPHSNNNNNRQTPTFVNFPNSIYLKVVPSHYNSNPIAIALKFSK